MNVYILIFISIVHTSVDSLKKGRDYLIAGEYKKAIPFLKEGFQLGWAYENLGDYNRAITYYKEADTLLKEHSLYRIANCLKELGQYDAAITYYEELADKFPDFVFLNWAMQELAWCYEKVEDYENAIAVWEEKFTPPFSWYKVAQIYDKIGESPDSLWIKIATQYPECEYAIKAIPYLPRDSVLLIGKIYYFAKEYDSTIAYLDEVEGGEEFVGLSLYKLGRYENALELAQFKRLFLLAGKCNKKLGRIEDAITAYTKSGTSEALFLKAQLLTDLGRKEEALITFSTISDTSSYFEYANLRAGLFALELGKLDVAYRSFRNIYTPASYYWRCRVMMLQKDVWRADVFRKKILEEYPISYYAWLLRGREGILDITPEEWIAKHDTSVVTPELQKRFECGKLLFELGITKSGLAEFKKLPPNPLLSWKIAKFLDMHGKTWIAIPYANRLKFKRGIPREVAKVAYPLAFFEEIQKVAQSYNIDEFLMIALVREESYFNPRAVSPANARGLAQIIPPTARKIAKQLGVKEYNLFHPATNLRFGAFYFAQSLESFNGSWECALAAYNAGPHRVKEWLAERKIGRKEEWVEWIPFKETRNYVKKIMRSYHVYKMLYGE